MVRVIWGCRLVSLDQHSCRTSPATPRAGSHCRAPEPSLSALKRLARALAVTIDELVFEDDGRGPDDELRLQFDAIRQFDPDEKHIVKALLDSLILKHQARRWASA